MVVHITDTKHDIRDTDMSGLKFSQIRAAIVTQIQNVSGMRLSKQLPDYFGRMQDTVAHKGFTVEIGISTQRTDERQRISVGVYVQTAVIVKVAYRLRPLDVYPTDYDLALDLEDELIHQILQSYQSIQAIQIRFNQVSRQSTVSNEYILSTIEFTVYHTLKQ